MTARQVLASFKRTRSRISSLASHHEAEHGCSFQLCEVADALLRAWSAADQYVSALEWLLDGKHPSRYAAFEWCEWFPVFGPELPPEGTLITIEGARIP